MLVDSHCHLDLLDLDLFDNQMENVLAAAKTQGVEGFLTISVNLDDTDKLIQIAERFPQVWTSIGLHPNEQPGEVPTVEQLLALAQNTRVVAIGETGLDYFRTDEGLAWQQKRFEHHIEAAIAVNKPLIIHARDAKEDTLAILRNSHADKVGGVMHCFTEDWEMAKAAMALGFYISFSGIVTFKNATTLQAVAQKMPIDRILIETDCPYLAPVPFRGKPNQPAYVKYVAECIAALRKESFERIAEATTKNFYNCFPLAIGELG